MKTTTTTHPAENKPLNRLTSLASLAVILTLAGNSITTRASIVAHWTFDESGGAIAHDSAGPYNGTLSPSGAAFAAGGISGNAVSLTKASNGFVNMGNVLGMTSGDFSVVAWVKMTTGDTTDSSFIVCKQAGGYPNGYVLAVNKSDAHGQVNKAWFYDSGLPGNEAISTTSVNDGNWHQLVGVYRAGGTILVYVDGAPAEASKASLTVVANTGNLLIGGDTYDVPYGLFTGLVDDVQIYNHALSDGDVDFLFQHPGQVVGAATPKPAALLAHWTFDEPSGTVAHDSAGPFNGNLSPSGAAFAPGGISGNAISLSKAGNGFVNMGNVLALTNGDFSIVSWVKMTPGDTTDSSTILAKQASGFLNGYQLNVNTSGGIHGQANKAMFYDSGLPGTEAISTTSVNDGSWHQVVGVYRAGSTILIYVDGAPAEATKPSRTIIPNSASFQIGGLNIGGVPTGLFTGLIDDVQVYNRALSDGDVDFLFQHPSQVVYDCSENLAASQAQLAAANAANVALQTQLAAANGKNVLLQTQLANATATNAALTAQLAAANTSIASLQTQLGAANGTIGSLQLQLVTCNGSLATANQTILTFQNEIADLLAPMHLMTDDFRTTFRDPQFVIPGDTAVDQMQNLISEIVDFPRGLKQPLYLGLGGHLNFPHRPADGVGIQAQ